MTLLSKSFKMVSIVALNGAVAATAACTAAPPEVSGASDQAATADERMTACNIQTAYAENAGSLTFQPFDASTFAALTGITPPRGSTSYAQFTAKDGTHVYVLARGTDVLAFYTNGKLAMYFDNIAGLGRWETPDGEELACFSSPGGDDDDDSVGGTCLNKDPIDATAYEYKKARAATTGACTTKELSDFSGYYKAHATENDLIDTWPTAVSQKCAECIFTDETAGPQTSWAPMVITDDQTGSKNFNVNRGGCIEQVSGSEACGRAYQQFQDCTLEACLKDCKTQTEFTKCRQDATVLTTSCKDAYAALKNDCGETKIGHYETACKGTSYTFEGPIKVACIKAP